MNGEVLVAAVALIVSALALAASSTIAVRQLRFMRAANHVPVAIELLTREFMHPGLQEDERRVLEGLPNQYSDLGFSQLPDPLRAAAHRVAWYYDAIGTLVAFGFVQENLITGTMNHRIRQFWGAIQHHVDGKRAIRGAPFLDFLEDLAARVHAKDPRMVAADLGLRTLPRIGVPRRTPAAGSPPVNAATP